jgi:hypothetical protein
MGLIERGLKWHQDVRHKKLSESILVGDEYSSAKRLDATVTCSDDVTTAENSNGNIQFFTFIFRSCDLERFDIKIYRGLKFWRGKDSTTYYEVVVKNKQMFYYDDPMKRDVCIWTRLVGDTTIAQSN